MLTVRNLRRPGLSPVSFDLADGECLAVQGPSGAGKTLLLRAIADLDPSEGLLKLNGISREAIPGPLWRRKVAYVPAAAGWWSDRVGAHFSDWTLAAPLVEPCCCQKTWIVGRCTASQPASASAWLWFGR
jgi:phosphate-transporting ATPase